jgi:hypothetical protein
VKNSCREMFAVRAPRRMSSELGLPELSKLTGRAGLVGYGNYFEVTLHNGNTQVDLSPSG